jgi:hypothetical protein
MSRSLGVKFTTFRDASSMGRIIQGTHGPSELHSGTHRSGTRRYGISIFLPCLHASHVPPKRNEEEYSSLCTSILMVDVSPVSLLDGDVHRGNYCSSTFCLSRKFAEIGSNLRMCRKKSALSNRGKNHITLLSL